MLQAGAGAEVQVGVAADIDCADGDGLRLCPGVSIRSSISVPAGISGGIGIPAGISAHQGLHDLLHALGGKGDLPVLTDAHALRQDDLCAKGDAIGQGGAVGLRGVPVLSGPVRSGRGGLHGLRGNVPAGGVRGSLRRKADGGEVAHHQNARQKAGDHVIDLHAVHPP